MREENNESALEARLHRILAANFEAYALSPAVNLDERMAQFYRKPRNEPPKTLRARMALAKIIYFSVGITLGITASFRQAIVFPSAKDNIYLSRLLEEKKFPVVLKKDDARILANIDIQGS